MSVTYKGITFVSIHDAAKFLSEPVWRVEETLYGEVGEIEQEFPFCWLLVLCLAIATASAILALAHANQSVLTYRQRASRYNESTAHHNRGGRH